MRDQRNRVPRNVDTFNRALVEAPRDDRVASAEIGIFADPARTQHSAVAHFEQAPFEMVGHHASLAVDKYGCAVNAAAATHPTPAHRDFQWKIPH